MDNEFRIPERIQIDCYRLADAGWDIVPAPSKRAWMDETHGHASKCLPLLAANQMGYHILSPTDVSIIWDGSTSASSLKVIAEDPKFDNQILSHFGHGTFTFQIPYLFRTSDEIGLFVRGSTNFWVDGAVALDGFVETNWSNYSFTMNWRATIPHKIISFRKGDPICMIIPYPTRLLENINIQYKPISEAPAEMVEIHKKWSSYRNEFNNRKDRKINDWQKDYFLGKKCPFSDISENNKGSPHRTKFKLPRFDQNQ
jgi:hypothetical protein